jgi:hypothetical protein
MRTTRQVRILGACLLAMLALAAITASGASASLPELGGCEAAPTGHGSYKDSACVEKVTGAAKKAEGDYEWYTGNDFGWVFNREQNIDHGSPEQGFDIAMGATTFETTPGAHQIECSGGYGELHTNLALSTKEVSDALLDFEGCHEVGGEEAECASLGSIGGAEINDKAQVGENEGFKGTLGFLEGKGGEEPKVGLSLTGFKSGEILMTVSCLGPEGTVWIGGTKKANTVISTFEPVDTMTKVFTQTYAASTPGVQQWTSFEGKHKSVLDEFVLHNFEQSAWNSTFEDNKEGRKLIEIKARP